jgi:anhydro-N-acetylmuramic acid kinase
MALYLGLISGTSTDAVDAALVSIDDSRIFLEAFLEVPYRADVRARLERVVQSGECSLFELGALDSDLAVAFADAALELLAASGTDRAAVTALGSHGQTVVHSPDSSPAFTLQLGNPSLIAHRTGLVTVADFRSKDIVAGGQGAPLVPGFHAQLFRNSSRDVAVVNIGGISNVTLLPRAPSSPVIGFDCGPGNTLMDLWTQRHLGQAFDANGRWAASGRVLPEMLRAMKSDPFFARQPPKSTGRELFNLDWLDARTAACSGRVSPADVQATLASLTAEVITEAVRGCLPQCSEILVCGGGARNHELMRLLSQNAPAGCRVAPTDDAGLPASAVEACAFAWLAERRLKGLPGNVPSVTGAKAPVILGGVYEPR